MDDFKLNTELDNYVSAYVKFLQLFKDNVLKKKPYNSSLLKEFITTFDIHISYLSGKILVFTLEK